MSELGNRCQQTFFSDAGYAKYRRLLADASRLCGTEALAHCWLLNYVHLLLVPAGELGLRGALGEANRRYTRMVNTRQGWKGRLW